MVTAQQSAAVNGSSNASGTRDRRLICDDRVRVFHAREQDVDALVTLLHSLHYESPKLNTAPFSIERTTDTVLNMISRSYLDTLALVCYSNAQPVACMGAMMCPQLTSKDLIATELVLYVTPEKRGSRAAYMMIQVFEDWAKPHDMRAGSSLGIDDDKAINFYSRLGYEPGSIGVFKRGLK